MEKRARIAVKAVAIIIVLLVAYALLPVINGIVENPPGAAYIVFPEKVSFEFERFVNVSAGTFTINFTIPGNSSFQTVTVVDESHYPKSVHHDYNKTWWSYSLSCCAEIKLRYRGEARLQVWKIENSEGVDAIPQSLKNQYNHAEYIDLGDGERKYVINPEPFRNVTLEATKDKPTVLGKLRAIYDLIVKNFRYQTQRKGLPRTAVETWNSGEGDCDELSFVFVSMARSIGIPAWVEYGQLYDGSRWGGHAWVRTVIPHDGKVEQVNIDVTVEVGREDLGRGFLIRDPYRFTEWIDDGNSEHLSSYYTYITYTTPPQFHYDESVKVIRMDEVGTERIPVGGTIPSWLMLLIVVLIIAVVIAIIARW